MREMVTLGISELFFQYKEVLLNFFQLEHPLIITKFAPEREGSGLLNMVGPVVIGTKHNGWVA